MNEQLKINNVYIPLTKSINPSITRSIAEIQEPNKRKATYSKTIFLPDSKELRTVIGQIHDINLVDGIFNPVLKADVLYTVDGSDIINGYCQLKKVTNTSGKEIGYDMVLFGNIASLFSVIGSKFLHDLDLSQWNHPFTKEIQVLSWDAEVFDADLGMLVPFALGKGYVYALVDYGFSSDSITFKMEEIGVSVYVKEYWDKIFEDSGFTYTSAFLDSDAFKALIIPSSPETFSFTSAEIIAREFSANTPEFTSTGTVTTGNLSLNSYGANDTIIFSNELADPSGIYDPVTGVYTIAAAGFYAINSIVELNATFSPTVQPAVTLSEVRAKIRVIHTPISSGIPVVIDEVQAFITRDNGLPTSDYPYTTSSTPVFPDPDYLNDTRYTILPFPNDDFPRNFNPPDRYLISVSGVFLAAGDTIEIAISAGLFKTPLTNYFDSGGGNATLTCAVGAFFNKVANTTLSEGNTFLINKAIPLGYKQKDFIMSIVKMFNLYLDVDPNNVKNLIIEPRDDYYGSTVRNIDDLIAVDKGIQQIPMGALNGRRYIYRYKEDKDFFNQEYIYRHQETYGEREVIVLNDFVQKDVKNEIIFSPTPIVALPGNDRVLPTIIAQNDLGEPISTKHNIRILYYGGLIDNFENWFHQNTVSVFGIPLNTPHTNYPYAGHFDHPYNPTLDINFGLVKELFYDDNINPIVWTNNNLYNKYWSKFINEITSKDSKLVKVFVNMSHANFKEWSFRDSYYFNNAYHRLNKEVGFNPTNQELTKIEFIKIKESPLFIATSNITTGAPEGIELPPPGADNDDGETAPVFGDSGSKSNFSKDGNNYNSKTQQVEGEGNFVSKGAKDVCIKGDGNSVYESNHIVLDNSHDNVIDSGLRNVTLINTVGLTITESFVTYIDGIKSTPALGDPIEVKQISASQDIEPTVKTYEIDTSGGDVTMSFTPTVVNYQQGQIWIFKKTVQANKLIIAVIGGTLDGESSIPFKTKRIAISTQYDGGTDLIIV